jgi:hypothetical protein
LCQHGGLLLQWRSTGSNLQNLSWVFHIQRYCSAPPQPLWHPAIAAQQHACRLLSPIFQAAAGRKGERISKW